jgi:hypothetical protein
MSVTPAWTPEAIRFSQDAETGAEIEQLTSEPVTSTNIYCEQRYASADGTRIALSRKPFGQPTELWVCDMRSLRLCRVVQATPLGANSALSVVYGIARRGHATILLRVNLVDLTVKEMCSFDGLPAHGGAPSHDERWYVAGPFPVRDNLFSLSRTDLATGRTDTLCEIADISGHMQFDPGGSGQTIVQINRGRRRDMATGGGALTGPLGATLSVVDVETGKVLPLPVGRPHTPPISGHECWVGKTGEILFTAGQYNVTSSAYVTLKDPPDDERAMPQAALYAVKPGDRVARVVARDLLFNHLAASDDGRYFIADDHTTGSIYIGSVATGRSVRLCDSHTRQGTCQYSHVHPYMTPDNKYVIFNSIVTGVAQVYAARVPDGFLAAVG